MKFIFKNVGHFKHLTNLNYLNFWSYSRSFHDNLINARLWQLNCSAKITWREL